MINGFERQKPFVDELARMKGQGYPVGRVLWAGNRPNDHSDHIHIEGAPSLSKPGRKPPCAGGGPITEGSILDIDLATFKPLPGGSEALAEQGFFKPLELPLLGELGFSWGQVVFGIIAILVGIVLIQFLMKGFADKTGITQAATKVVTKGLA
jgi:hypothetical protein